MKILIIFSFVLVVRNIFAFDYRDQTANSVIAPFGMPSRQPPAPGRVIQIPEVKLSISAQQVCGYTDWSTLQIELPKQLLSKLYWDKVGENLVAQAKQTVLDLSHALPSMLACNVSPTYCHVFNQAELSAFFEGQLNLETCKIVDGLATNSVINDDLRQCMGSWNNAGLTSSESREKCLTNGVKGARDAKDKSNAVKASREQAEEKGYKSDRFDMNKFIDGLFPESIKTTTGTYNFNSGGHTYSRRERTASLMRELFPGIEVRGSAVVRNGGTFQPTIEEDLTKETKEIRDEIFLVLKEMKSWQEKGYSGVEVIEKSKHIWSDKSKWKDKKIPSPIYRATIDGTEPTELVSPEQIFSLLPLIDKKIEGNRSLEQVIDRISQSGAYVKSQDKLYDIHSRTLTDCEKPENQSSVAKENCERIITRTKVAMEVLEHKMLAEDRVRVVQEEISQIVIGVQRSRVSRMISEPHSDYRKSPSTDSIHMPNDGG